MNAVLIPNKSTSGVVSDRGPTATNVLVEFVLDQSHDALAISPECRVEVLFGPAVEIVYPTEDGVSGDLSEMLTMDSISRTTSRAFLPRNVMRSSPRSSSDPDGTGFGLAIVEKIAEAHGWKVRVTENSSGGARFEITNVTSADE